MSPNQQYADAAVICSIHLQALTTWLLFALIDRLDLLQKEIQSAIAFYDPSGTDADALIEAARQKIQEAYREIEARISADYEEMATEAAKKERDDLFVIFGLEFDPVTGAAILAGLVIVGLTLSESIKRQMGELEFRTIGALRRGIQNGDTLGELIQRINGSSDLGGEMVSKVVEPSQRAIEQLARTATEAIQERSRELSVDAAVAEIEANPPEPETPTAKFIRYGWISLAILDARTTSLCRSYHGKIWDKDHKPINHALPWLEIPRHPYCRSRHTVIILDDPPARKETFAEWMARQDEAEQKRIFGAKALELWRRKVISDSDLIRSRERQLTFEQFRNT